MEIEVRLDLPLMGKARPRCGQRRAYLPAPYREWKRQAAAALREHWERLELPTIQQAELLEVYAYGPGRHDPDNLMGALLDAGLPDKAANWRGCWRDDRVTVFPRTLFEWKPSSQQSWRLKVLLGLGIC